MIENRVAFRELRKREGQKINPATAVVRSEYRPSSDPYGLYDDYEEPGRMVWASRQRFARAPDSDIWVWFGDLPESTLAVLNSRSSPPPPREERHARIADAVRTGRLEALNQTELKYLHNLVEAETELRRGVPF